MGTMYVTLNGKETLKWSADEAAIRRMERTVAELAAYVNLPPDDLALRDFAKFPKMVLRKGESEDDIRLSFISYFLLSMDTHHPDRPGKLRGYLPSADFTFDVRTNFVDRTNPPSLADGTFRITVISDEWGLVFLPASSILPAIDPVGSA